MVEVLDVEEFLSRRASSLLCDVRTPAEYLRGHIPGAASIPLFSDAERAEVGTVYKRSGREPAMLRSLELVGPRARKMVEAILGSGTGPLLLYCWRGGMRSAGVAELLRFFGRPAAVLRGGYKAYRRLVTTMFDLPFQQFCLVGGKTGSGKTEVLQALRQRGEQVIDLENLAGHRGSAFGGIGRPPQPGQEHFENLLGEALRTIDRRRRVWLEDESRLIGQCQVPAPLWERMRQSLVLFLDLPEPARLAHVVSGYRDSPVTEASAAIYRIQKRLGGEQTQRAQKAVADGQVLDAAEILLSYYDRTYMHALSRRPAEKVMRLAAEAIDADRNADLLINRAKALLSDM